MYMGAGWLGFSNTENEFLGLSPRVKRNSVIWSNVLGAKATQTQRVTNIGKFQAVPWLYYPKWQYAESEEKPILRENIPRGMN